MLLFSFLYCFFLEGSHYAQFTLNEPGVLLPILRVEYLHILFGILHGRFFFSPLFIVIYLYQYGYCHLFISEQICFIVGL